MEKKVWRKPEMFQLDIRNTEAYILHSENCDKEWIGEDNVKHRTYS